MNDIKRLNLANTGKDVRISEGGVHIKSLIHGVAFIYTNNGQLECVSDIHPGEQTIRLGSGVHVIVINGCPYKIKM